MIYSLACSVIVILVVIFGKWVAFIFLSPIIIKFNNKKKWQACKTAEDDARYLACQNEFDSIHRNNSSHSYFKSLIRRYIEGFIRYMQFQVSYIPSHHIRDYIYKNIYLVKLGKKAVIYYGTEIRGSYYLTIGKGSIIGDRAVLDARRGGIEIGDNVQLGSFVKLWTGSHNHDDPYFRSTPDKRGPIKIGDRAWLGPNVTVLHSVSIGEGAVVAAGAVVTKNVEPFSIVGGVPAKKIGERIRNLCYEFNGDYLPFY